MADVPSGSVPLKIVEYVLECLSAEGAYSVRLDDVRLTIVREQSPQVVVLSDPVGRKMVQYLAHKYCGGKPELFYHPEFLDPNGTKTKN